MASTPRTPAPERSPPPVPTPPPPLEDEPPPYLADGSPREEASFSSDGREGAPPKNPQLSPTHHAAPRLVPPPSSPARQDGQEQEGSANKAAAATAEPAREPLRQMATGLARPLSSQTSPATTNSPTPSASPTPSSPAPVANNSKRSGQSTPKRAETKLPLSSPAVAVHFDPVEEAVTSPLRLGKARLDQQQQQQHAAGAAESGASVVPGVAAAVAAVAERRELLLALRLATAVLSLAAFSVIASARTSGWAGDYYARHLQYRYAVAVNVIVFAYSVAQSLGKIRHLVSPRFTFRTMSSYYCSLFLDQASSGVPPHVGVVGGRVAQRPVGVQVRHGRLRQEDHRRPVAVLRRVPGARSERGHLHG
uniref:CASP-like protein n=2 Tax=Zea mays TaxID=4577 RepID=A0A804UHG2_MAIZE